SILFVCATMLQPNALFADMIPVRHTEGLIHGFLLVLTFEGKALADGQMTQDAQGDRVTNHLIFRFKDGSIYEDTTIFSQRGTFRLLSDHLSLKGPSFRQQVDTSIDASAGQVKVRYTQDNGKEKVIAQRMELPPDVANGLLFTLMKDINRVRRGRQCQWWRPRQSHGWSSLRSFRKGRNRSRLEASVITPCTML